jgi:hypothetical protein
LVEHRAPGLLARLVIERSPSGGWHVVYRCQTPPCGNIKLAERAVPVVDDREVEFYGRKYKPRVVNGRHEVWLTLIETRAEGGLFLCAPSPNYELAQGRFEEVPLLSDQERESLLEPAWSQNELRRPAEPIPEPPADSAALDRPGDDYNARGDVRGVLRKHGWTLARSGENEYWRRPGKTDGWSATFKEGVFFVHSSNAAPFEPGRPYAPFAVYTLLEHGGDFAAAASTLRAEGLGQSEQPAVAIVGHVVEDAADRGEARDPGPTPEHLLTMPGFVRDVMQYSLDNAPYPDPALAFAGALSLQALLAGRKVRDASDNRTNLYVVALANSGAGKDFPRKTNEKILLHAGMAESLGDEIGSAEGMLDDLEVTSNILFQTDEIDVLMQSMNQPKESRYQRIMQALLKLFTSANGLYPKRKKVNKERGYIDQPNVCLYGTAIPDIFYKNLSLKMLTNGWFARLLILECLRRGVGREDDTVADVPKAILDVARWWVEFQPGQAGNLQQWHPTPKRIEATPQAKRRLSEFRRYADAQYRQHEAGNHQAGMAIWARAVEKAKKLALIYACSENHLEPIVTEPGVNWACELIVHQTLRMLFMAGLHVADSDFDAKCKRVLELLSEWQRREPDAWLAFRDISRKLRWSKREHDDVREALREQELIQSEYIKTRGRSRLCYRLVPPQAA